MTLANAFFADYDYITSQRELKTALELEPQNPDALSLSAYLAIAACHLDEAERSARQLIDRDPLSVDPYRALGTALWFKGRLNEAEAVYRRVIALFPSAESMRYRLSLVLLSAGRPQDALREADAETGSALEVLRQSHGAGCALSARGSGPRARAGRGGSPSPRQRRSTSWPRSMPTVAIARAPSSGSRRRVRRAIRGSSATSSAIRCWRSCAAIRATRRCSRSSTCRPDLSARAFGAAGELHPLMPRATSTAEYHEHGRGNAMHQLHRRFLRPRPRRAAPPARPRASCPARCRRPPA